MTRPMRAMSRCLCTPRSLRAVLCTVSAAIRVVSLLDGGDGQDEPVVSLLCSSAGSVGLASLVMQTVTCVDGALLSGRQKAASTRNGLSVHLGDMDRRHSGGTAHNGTYSQQWTRSHLASRSAALPIVPTNYVLRAALIPRAVAPQPGWVAEGSADDLDQPRLAGCMV
jgi:hypothetical protein